MHIETDRLLTSTALAPHKSARLASRQTLRDVHLLVALTKRWVG
jgi:hypothetical protein